jgi:hypothetical protein
MLTTTCPDDYPLLAPGHDEARTVAQKARESVKSKQSRRPTHRKIKVEHRDSCKASLRIPVRKTS